MSRRERLEEIERLYRQLRELARRQFLAKPHARDIVRSMPPLDLNLKIDFSGRLDGDSDQAAAIFDALDQHIDDAILAQAAFRPGRVFCFFCESAECEHAGPDDPRQVFDGYSETGLPVWTSFLDLALAREDPRVQQLVATRGRPFLLGSTRQDLIENRLPDFARAERVYDIRGQLTSGYYTQGNGNGSFEKFAITAQIIRCSTRTKVVRLGLNTIGLLPDGAEAESALESGGRWSFLQVLHDTERRMAAINQDLRRLPKGRRLAAAADAADELLGDLVYGTTRKQRRKSWRTEHATERAAQKERPTGMARQDLESVRHDRVYYDSNKDTYVILGGRGRTHVFTEDGRHVTSLHLDSRAVKFRTRQKRWQPMQPDRVKALLAAAKARFEEALEPE